VIADDDALLVHPDKVLLDDDVLLDDVLLLVWTGA
jgi:hypothetical protein